MTKRTTSRIGFGTLGAFVLALTVACGGAPAGDPDEIPVDEPTLEIVDTPAPVPGGEETQPGLGEDPGDPSHGPVEPSDDE